VKSFTGGFGLEFFLVVGRHGFIFGGVFAGKHDGGGIHTVLEGVEAGNGFAFDGPGTGGFLGVGAIGADLSFARHGYDVPRWQSDAGLWIFLSC